MSKNIDYSTTYIAVKKLSVVWVKSQRPYNEGWAKSIAENFDPDKFEPVIVTQPNGAGIYHIIEGQHRTRAVEMMWGGGETIPCRVLDEADPKRAAEIWLGINAGRKAIRPITEFLVAVEAQRENEVAISAVVRRAGYKIGSNAGSDNTISAVGVLRKIFAKYGEKILYQTLQTCRLVWGSDSHGAAGAILSGLGLFLNEFHGHVDAGHLRKAITNQYKSPGNFVEAARYESDETSETLEVAMSNLLRKKYNLKQRDDKKLKRKEA
jgi:hypothetical protein